MPEWKKVDTLGLAKPGALSHHTSVVHGDKMYLFGGSGPRTQAMIMSGLQTPALWSLDLKNFRWEAMQYSKG